MSPLLIPADQRVKRLAPSFTKEDIPVALLSHHSTAAGAFGQLCVMEGTITYYGFVNEQATGSEEKVAIHVGQFTTSLSRYWHRVEPSDNARFNIHFWVAEEVNGENGLFHVKKA